MKNKKLLIYILTVLAMIACVCFVGCFEEEPQQSEVLAPVVINIQQESEVLGVLEEITLTVTTENATGVVVWNSSDKSIATVNNGVVKGLSAGIVTITATVNGVSDSCTVEVLRSNEVPILSVSRTKVSIEKDSEYTLTASVKWMGEDITNEVDLKWEIGSGAQEGVVSIIPKSNGEVSLKGVAIGETDVYVSVTVGDVYVNQKISVTVCDSSIWFESEELEIGANGNFMLKMFALSADGNENRVDIPTIFAYQNGEKIQNASFEWISKDESIVKIEGGKLVAKRAGLVNLHGVYAGNEVVLSVLVERSSVYIEEIVNFELADLKPVELDALVNENGEVYLQGAQIGALEDGKIILDASKYPTSSKELGSCELVVETDKSSYYIPTNLYSMIIETPEELDAWHSFAFEQEDDGYFVLGNNIAYNGAYTGSRNWDKSGYAWASPDNVGFKGIFDGNGYVIDGLRIESGFRGFVTLLQSDGIIRNVSFINASYSAIGAYLCQWGCGTIENVYVQYGIDARTGYYDKNTALGGAFLAADNTRNMVGKMTIKNCFVDVRRTSLEHDYQSYIGGYMKYDKTNAVWIHDGAYAMLNGVYVIGPATTLKGGEAKLHYNDLVEGSINYGLYHSAGEMASDSKTQAVIAQWDSSFWGIKNGMPIPLSVMVLGDVYVVNKPSTSGYYTFEGDTTVYSGDNYTFTVKATKAGFSDFTVLVNGKEMNSDSGEYTLENVQSDLDIKVVHSYFESGSNQTTVEYLASEGAWKLNNAVLASYPGLREHANAYLSKEYIEYMMAQGYTKLQFTVIPDGTVAVKALYRYNGKDLVAYDETLNGMVTINLTVASELEIWGTNNRGSGSAIKDQGSYLTVTQVLFSK